MTDHSLVKIPSEVPIVCTDLSHLDQEYPTFITPTDDTKSRQLPKRGNRPNTAMVVNSAGLTANDDECERILMSFQRYGIYPASQDIPRLRRYITRKKTDLILLQKYDQVEAVDRISACLGPLNDEDLNPRYNEPHQHVLKGFTNDIFKVRMTPTRHGGRRTGVVLKPVGQIQSRHSRNSQTSYLSKRISTF